MKSNSTWVITFLHVVGVLILVAGAFGFITSGASDATSKYGFAILIGAVVISVPFFFFAQVLQNLIEQTNLLNDIKENTKKEIPSYFDKEKV